MTTYYVGPDGNNSNNGTTWALRKLTLNGAEDIPVAAGDTVYVGPGTYRELLTLDVSGTAGNPITYIGDYSGANTNGVGGIVRITGSDDDIAATRANCILNSATRNYRTFSGFLLNLVTATNYDASSGCTHNIINNCAISCGPTYGIGLRGSATNNNNQITNCLFFGQSGTTATIFLSHSAQVDDSSNLINNCIFIGRFTSGLHIAKIGGITIKNSTFIGQGPITSTGCIHTSNALTGGQTITVNNCIFTASGIALIGQSTADITEDYNSFFSCGTNRTNTNTGANSLTYPPSWDTRWFFEMISGNGKMISPFDLASFSPLINVAGTSPTSTDMRRTGTVGAQREWGALEYDPALLYRRVIQRNS